MSVVDCPYFKKLVRKKTIEIGELYFFDKFLVCEFNEGVDIDFQKFNEAKIEIEKQFGENEFGFIGNRIHSYSIIITDAHLFNEEFKNLKAYATITYSKLASKVFEIENHFFTFNRKNFSELEEAIQWIEENLDKPKTNV